MPHPPPQARITLNRKRLRCTFFASEGPSIKNLSEKVEEKRLDGGVLVARTLVHAYVKDPGGFAEVAERARYCQILAGKMRLEPLDAHRVVLSAWLSALDENRQIVDPLINEYQLGAIIGPASELGDAESKNPGAQILSLIMGYQELKKRYPGLEKEIPTLREALQQLWALSPARQEILPKFVRMLEDEKFLQRVQAPAGKVLIVDPDEVVSTVLSIPLRNHGYTVRAVGNVPDAEKALADDLPDLVIAEMRLPVEDGLSLCQKMRAVPATHDLPLIMMTSSRSTKEIRKCYKAGADDVVSRPIDMELFFLKLRKMLEARVAKRPQEGIVGALKDIALTDLVQILCAGGRSVRVHLRRNGDEGLIFISDGQIVDSSAGELRGEEAFYRLMSWKEGSFSGQPCDEFPPRTIDAPTMSLLMEGARRNDEGSA